jgi:sRNA-binding protein
VALTSFSAVRRGTAVKVFMGAGWEKGKVIRSQRDSCTVQLANRSATVYDLRNIKLA